MLSFDWLEQTDKIGCNITGLGKKIIPLEGKSYHAHDSCKKAAFCGQVLFGMYMFLISIGGITGNFMVYFKQCTWEPKLETIKVVSAAQFYSSQ